MKDKKNKQLLKTTEVENTPFTVVEYDNDEKNKKEIFVSMGKYRISENLESKEEAIEYAKEIDWNKIIQVIGIMIDNQN